MEDGELQSTPQIKDESAFGLFLKIRFILFHILFLGAAFWVEPTKQTIYAGIFLYFIRMFGVTAGYHRYFSHKSYETTKFKERILLWLGTVAGVGSCLSWATMHRLHHRDADTEDDPHSPYFRGWIKPFFGIPSTKNYDHKITRDLLRDSHQRFTHKHYFKINLLFIPPASFTDSGHKS